MIEKLSYITAGLLIQYYWEISFVLLTLIAIGIFTRSSTYRWFVVISTFIPTLILTGVVFHHSMVKGTGYFTYNNGALGYVGRTNITQFLGLVWWDKLYGVDNFLIVSQGGMSSPAYWTSTYLENNDITVLTTEYCSSACTVIFFTPNIGRYVVDSAEFLFHSPVKIFGDKTANGQDTQEIINHYSQVSDNLADTLREKDVFYTRGGYVVKETDLLEIDENMLQYWHRKNTYNLE